MDDVPRLVKLFFQLEHLATAVAQTGLPAAAALQITSEQADENAAGAANGARRRGTELTDSAALLERLIRDAYRRSMTDGDDAESDGGDATPTPKAASPLVSQLAEAARPGAAEALRVAPLLTVVVEWTIQEIESLRESLTAAALAAVAPETALRLAGAAWSADAPELWAAAAACVRAHLTESLTPDGLAALPRSACAALLSHPGIAVDTEMAVFDAAAAWVAIPRRPGRRLATVLPAVRLSRLARHELESVDRHPLVRDCEACTRAVACAVIRWHTGVVEPPRTGGEAGGGV